MVFDAQAEKGHRGAVNPVFLRVGCRFPVSVFLLHGKECLANEVRRLRRVLTAALMHPLGVVVRAVVEPLLTGAATFGRIFEQPVGGLFYLHGFVLAADLEGQQALGCGGPFGDGSRRITESGG